MGFSLGALFRKLFAIITDDELDEQEKLALLTTIINEQYEYAKECGQLRKGDSDG